MSLAKLQILKHKNVKKNFKIFISMSSSNEKVELNDCGSSTLFKCIQDLYLKSSGVYKTDKLSKLWDPTYTLVFICFFNASQCLCSWKSTNTF